MGTRTTRAARPPDRRALRRTVTIAEFPDDAAGIAAVWERLAAHLAARPADLLVLPELPAYPGFWTAPAFDAAVWREAVRAHQAMLDRLEALRAAAVVATRPVERDGRRLNEAFVWTRDAGYRAVRRKRYLPDESGAYERSWYEPGAGDFSPVEVHGVTVGILICTEVMFNRHARDLAAAGAHLVAVPRATGNHERWPVALRMTAIASGAFVASANRRGPDETLFAGAGLLVGPDGEVLAATSQAEPFCTLEIDLGAAVRAKTTYPRSVPG